jgi:hypothetical protein
MLKDFTRDIDRERKGLEGARVSVIWMCSESTASEYARDQLADLDATTADHAACVAAAHALFERDADHKARRVVAGFRIERW